MFPRMTRERYLSDSELEAFMRAVRERRHVHQPRDHALFALLANTGIRPSEALALTRSDLHLGGKEPWMRVRRLKKKRLRPQFDDLVLTDELAAAARAHLTCLDDRDDRVFGLGRRAAQRLFHYYARRAGIVRRCYLYMLRHTAATRIYRATRDIAVVQALLGHESPDTSTIYAHVPRAMLSELATTFPVVI